MKTYSANWHIKREGRVVQPGETLELSDVEAAGLGEAVSPAPQAEPDQAADTTPAPKKRAR